MCRIYVQDIVLTVFSSLTIDPVTGESNKTDQLTLWTQLWSHPHSHTSTGDRWSHLQQYHLRDQLTRVSWSLGTWTRVSCGDVIRGDQDNGEWSVHVSHQSISCTWSPQLSHLVSSNSNIVHAINTSSNTSLSYRKKISIWIEDPAQNNDIDIVNDTSLIFYKL